MPSATGGFQTIEGADFPKGNEYFSSFTEPGVRRLWQKGVELGLIIELHIGPNFGKEVADMLREAPETVVLIDHFAEPHSTGTPRGRTHPHKPRTPGPPCCLLRWRGRMFAQWATLWSSRIS